MDIEDINQMRKCRIDVWSISIQGSMLSVIPMKYAHSFVVLLWLLMAIHVIFFHPYSSRSLHWHWGNRMIAPGPVKESWRIWVKYIDTKPQQNANRVLISWDALYISFQCVDGLVQKRRNSVANALELYLSHTNPSMWCIHSLMIIFWIQNQNVYLIVAICYTFYAFLHTS